MLPQPRNATQVQVQNFSIRFHSTALYDFSYFAESFHVIVEKATMFQSGIPGAGALQCLCGLGWVADAPSVCNDRRAPWQRAP